LHSTENSEEPFFFAIFVFFCGQFIFDCGFAAPGLLCLLRKINSSAFP